MRSSCPYRYLCYRRLFSSAGDSSASAVVLLCRKSSIKIAIFQGRVMAEKARSRPQAVLFARQSPEQAWATRRSVCVFCGSNEGDDPQFVRAAEGLGAALAREGLGLVYGGGSFGLMGVIARATIKAGGHVVEIIPASLCSREKPPADLHELVITTSMHARKQTMFDRSSAFVALPGGVGTLDETVEQMTWMSIGHHRKPIIFLNVAGYWDPILTMFDRMQARNFLGRMWRSGLFVAPPR